MRETYSPAILASYVTFKELYNEGKYRSSYQILGEFIKYIIAVEHNYIFSLFSMKNHLKKVFGFELPTAVIKTSIKGIPGIRRGGNTGEYVVDEQQIAENEGFSEFRKEAEEEIRSYQVCFWTLPVIAILSSIFVKKSLFRILLHI